MTEPGQITNEDSPTMTLDDRDIASCGQLVSFIRARCDDQDYRAQVMVVAESLMRVFEIKKQIPREFRRSKNGINWISSSDQEVMPESYRDVAALLNQVARKFGDLRFVNTCLKILDARKTGSTEQEEIRLECSGILEEHE